MLGGSAQALGPFRGDHDSAAAVAVALFLRADWVSQIQPPLLLCPNGTISAVLLWPRARLTQMVQIWLISLVLCVTTHPNFDMNVGAA